MEVIQLFTILSKHADRDKNRTAHQRLNILEGPCNLLSCQSGFSNASLDLKHKSQFVAQNQ